MNVAASSASPFLWVAAQWAEKIQDQWAVFIDGYYVRIGKDRDQYFVVRIGVRAENIGGERHGPGSPQAEV